MNFISEVALFITKLLSGTFFLLLLLAAMTKCKSKHKTDKTKPIKLNHINNNYLHQNRALKKQLGDKNEKKCSKNKKKSLIKQPRVFVLSFDGDIRARQVEQLRREVTAILQVARPDQDQVLLRLESSGGLVSHYGLAAAQLSRLRAANIPLTACIDKIAASGGYLMACLANHIIAAPFAVVGSIGVVTQLPNFHELLEKNHIQFEQITAGEHKRTLTVFGKNTEKGREKVQAQVDQIWHLFKKHISQYRSTMNIEAVATGEYWFGADALKLQLIDKISTSDDILLTLTDTHQLYEVTAPPSSYARRSWQDCLNAAIYWVMSRRKHFF